MSDILPRLQKLVPLQEMVLASTFGGGSCSIVDFSDAEAGLYISGVSNSFGTPLAARGPREELEVLVRELQRGRPEQSAAPEPVTGSSGIDF